MDEIIYSLIPFRILTVSLLNSLTCAACSKILTITMLVMRFNNDWQFIVQLVNL